MSAIFSLRPSLSLTIFLSIPHALVSSPTTRIDFFLAFHSTPISLLFSSFFSPGYCRVPTETQSEARIVVARSRGNTPNSGIRVEKKKQRELSMEFHLTGESILLEQSILLFGRLSKHF